LYNTATIGTPANQQQFIDGSVVFTNQGWWRDSYGLWDGGEILVDQQPREQISYTHDKTDYLWYRREVKTSRKAAVTLEIAEFFDFVSVFADGNYVGFSTGPNATFSLPVTPHGAVNISILSSTVGLINYGVFLESDRRGLLGQIYVGLKNIRKGVWYHESGLLGEHLNIPSNPGAVTWLQNWDDKAVQKALTWYKASFKMNFQPTDKFALDLSSMGKGFVWINGKCIGRYFSTEAIGDCDDCDYAGPYNPSKCRTDCGSISQIFYHVPTDWLKSNDLNTIIIMEEISGDPNSIKVMNVKRIPVNKFK